MNSLIFPILNGFDPYSFWIAAWLFFSLHSSRIKLWNNQFLFTFDSYFTLLIDKTLRFKITSWIWCRCRLFVISYFICETILWYFCIICNSYLLFLSRISRLNFFICLYIFCCLWALMGGYFGFTALFFQVFIWLVFKLLFIMQVWTLWLLLCLCFSFEWGCFI